MKMTNDAHVFRRNAVALAVGGALTALAMPVLAEPLQQVTLYRNADMSRWSDNYVELGGLVNSTVDTGAPDSTYKFGEFSGLNRAGFYGVVNFNWITRQPDDDSMYSQVYGENVGLASKFLLDAGHQGHWRMTLGADRLTRYETDSAKFVHEGLGTDTLTLPTCAGVTFPTETVASIPSSCLKGYDIKQEREIYRLGVSGIIGWGWDYKLGFREDRREGSRLTGIYGNKAIIVPYPIDDHTQQVETLLQFASKSGQFQIGYNYSRYVNSFSELNVKDPFTVKPPSIPRVDLRMGLMPSNDQHHVQAISGYNFTRATRLTSQLSYSVSRQNDTFLPYTTNTAVPTPGAAPMPRSSLEGKVVNSLFDLGLTTKPVAMMNLKLGYQYRSNDNQTPISQYVYASRDSAQLTNPALVGAPATTGSACTAPGTIPSNCGLRAQVRSNAPISTREHKGVVDVDYEVFARTLLRTMFEYSKLNYELGDRDYTKTGKATVELRRPMSDTFLGSLGYVHTQRKGSDYDKNKFFRESYTDPNFQLNYRLDQHPSIRPFMYSDFTENRVRTSGTWTASEQVTLQGGVDAYRQRYRGSDCASIMDSIAAFGIANANGPVSLPDTCLGRTLAEGGVANLDLQWQLEENFATFAFANIAQTRTQQRGRQWSRAQNAPPTLTAPTPNINVTGANSTRDYWDTLTYRDMAIGLGIRFQPEKWDLGAQYVYSRGLGQSEIAIPANASLPAPAALPETESRLRSVQLYAKWNYSKDVTWRFNYWAERLMSTDWAYDGVSATSNAAILFTGQGSPNYWNHVFGVSVALSSW